MALPGRRRHPGYRRRPVELRGRRRERGAIDRFLDAVRAGEGRALVVRGDPGVGKTALLDYLADHSSGCRLTRAAGVESEMELEAEGEAFAAQLGCPHQNLQCLRRLSVDALVNNFPGNGGIPGVVDGAVLTEPIGTALAAGRFARVPFLNGTNHDEEALFVAIGRAVAQGTNVPIPEAVTPESYQRDIASVLAVSADRAAEIAAEYPIGAYPKPTAAFSTLVADASFVCPAAQVDRRTSGAVPTFAYEFNDDTAPQLYTPPGFLPPVATHTSELPYLFDLPNVPVPIPLNADQAGLATAIRTAAWGNFAAIGNPTSPGVPWPAFGTAPEPVLSLVLPHPQVETDFTTKHHCSFWTAG